jgi:hypothetical protein
VGAPAAGLALALFGYRARLAELVGPGAPAPAGWNRG